MTHKLLKISRFLSLFIILLLTVSTSAILFSGCGSSADAAKTGKSKKKKSKKSLDDETEDSADSEDSKDTKKEKDSEKPDEGEKQESDNSEKKSTEKADKKDTKGDEKEKSDKDSAKEADRIWQDLMKGNARFVSGKHTNAQYVSVRKSLTSGQKPEVIVLGCADSRVPPELVFGKNLGELFVVRAAGNIADLVELGSIEYAIEHLHSKVLVVLGHESCGAVGAAVSNEKMPTKNLSAIVNQIAPALEGSKTCPLGGKMNNSCVELNVQQSSKDIFANSPIVKKAVNEGELTIIRAVYELGSGKVVRLD